MLVLEPIYIQIIFTLTLSAHQLFESKFKEAIQDVFGDNTHVRHYFCTYFIYGGIHSDLAIEPSILLKTTEVSPTQLDINAKVLLIINIGQAISLRSSKSIVAFLGLKCW